MPSALLSLIPYALCALLAFYGGYTVRDNSAKKVEMEIAQTYADALIEASNQSQAWQDRYNQGVNDARTREKQLAADASAARAAAAGLRNTIEGLKRDLSNYSVEACRDTAEAALTVFGECTDKYREVAEAADGHASDAELCLATWPYVVK